MLSARHMDGGVQEIIVASKGKRPVRVNKILP